MLGLSNQSAYGAQRRWLLWCGLLLTLATSIYLMPNYFPLILFENWLSDVRLALLARPASNHPRVSIIEITEETLAKSDRRSPIDRVLLARLIDSVGAAMPEAIGIDILIDQPTNTEEDEAFLAALRRARVPIVLAWAELPSAGGFIQPSQVAYLKRFFVSIENPMVQRGLSYLREESDGVVRSFVLKSPVGETRDSFPVALARSAGSHPIQNADMVIDFYGQLADETQPFQRLPAHLIDSTVPDIWDIQKKMLAGHVVLIGASYPGADQHRTPFGSDPIGGQRSTPGVFLHAQAVAQLLDGRAVVKTPRSLWIFLIAATIGSGFLLGSLEMSLLLRTAAVTSIFALLCVTSVAIFSYGGQIFGASYGPAIPLASPVLGLLGAMMVGITRRSGRHAAEKQFVRSVLTRYVPPEVVRYLLAHPEDLRLGGERRELTLLFTDIAGFTRLCESTDPAVLVSTLNNYLDGISQIVHAHGGTVGGFIGDAVLAFWGAPLDDSDHARHGLCCAVEINEFAEAFRDRAIASGIDFGNTRIGVHSGMATVGNFGGPIRLEYTVYGDTVNTASRLEGANKYLSTRIAVSEATARMADIVPLRPAADLILQGKASPLAVFEPVREIMKSTLQEYLVAYKLLRQQDNRARDAFEALHLKDASDGLVLLHLMRLRRGESGTVINLTSK